MALFAGGHMAGMSDTAAVTLDCAVQFVSRRRARTSRSTPTVELLRETGRLAFYRGTVEQDGAHRRRIFGHAAQDIAVTAVGTRYQRCSTPASSSPIRTSAGRC